MKNPDSLGGGPGHKETQQCQYNRFLSHPASIQTTSRRRTVPASDYETRWSAIKAHHIEVLRGAT